jgi:hypothetical protein
MTYQQKIDLYLRSHLWPLLVIFSLAALVRLYNYPNRINFGPEQADSLLTAQHQITSGLSFLGQPYFARFTSTGHQLFASPLFTYSLIPLLKLSPDPLHITFYFTLLNLTTGLIFYLALRKLYPPLVSVLAVTLFLFNRYQLYHSLFIWILNYLPLIGVGLFYLLLKPKNLRSVFLLGLLSGIGIGLEYLFLPTLLLLGLLLCHSKAKTFLFIFAVALANLPTVIFELRHQGYHLFTLWQYFKDTLSAPAISALSYYHFLHLSPFIIFFLAWSMLKLSQRSPLIFATFITSYLFFNLSPSLFSLSTPIGMSPNWSYPLLSASAETIASLQITNFNVASLVPSDTIRALPLRYLLSYTHHTPPEPPDSYPTNSSLFLIAPDTYFPNPPSPPWEVSSLSPYTHTILTNFAGNYSLYRIDRHASATSDTNATTSE